MNRDLDSRPAYSNSPLADITCFSNIGQIRELEYGKNPDNKNVITNITLHVVAQDWNKDNFIGWAKKGNSAANYGIASDGTIIQIVDEQYSAGTNATINGGSIKNPYGKDTTNFSNNSVTLEISNLRAPSGSGTLVATNGKEYNFKNGKVEINGEYYKYPLTDEALDSTIKLVADIAKRNELGELYHDGVNGTLTWHSDFGSGKECPGDYVKKMTNYIIDCANEINRNGGYVPDYSFSFQTGGGLSEIVASGTNPFVDGSISSNMYTVIDSVNKIRSSISGNEAIVSAKKPSLNSTSTIPSGLVDAHSSLFSISSDLVSTINKETKVIASIAQTYYEMDQYLSSQASGLSDGSGNVDIAPYETKVQELINTDIFSPITFSTYMFNPTSHVEGNSGKVCLSDINSMLSGNSLTGPLYENLNSERENAKDTKNSIDSLIQNIVSHGELKGSAWDAVASKLGTYSELMDVRIDACNIMETATVKALKLIKDYMGEYEELDDSRLPILKQKIEELKADIEAAQNIMNATKQVTHTSTDANGKVHTYTTTEYVYSAAVRSQAKATIEAAKKLIQECEKEIAKLEGLPVILAQAEQIMNDALSEIYSKYGVQVNDVVAGKESTFTPPQNTSYKGSLPSGTKPFEIEREIPAGKVSEEEFNKNSQLQSMYGTYNDYLNGVKAENNPMYNPDYEEENIEEEPNLDNEDEFGSKPETGKPESGTEGSKPETGKPESGDTGSKPETGKPESGDTGSKPETGKPDNGDTGSKPETGKPDNDDTGSKPETGKPESGDTGSKPVTGKPEGGNSVSNKPNISYPSNDDVDVNIPEVEDNLVNDVVDNESNVQGDNGETIPPVVEIPDDEIVDITPDNVYDNNTDNSSSSNESSDLTKKIGIGLGVGAAVGAAALGAHTYSKAKKNNIYEED